MALLRRFDPWLPPLLLMAVIFALSAQPSLDSGLGAADVAARKLAHFAEYVLLAFLWWRVFVRVWAPRRAALAAVLVASLYAVTDEYHQSFVEGRHATAVDWGIDTAGATLAAWRLRSRRRVRA